MSEEQKEPRPIVDIQNAYGIQAAKLGDVEYKLACFATEKQNVIQSMSKLNEEAKARAELDKAAEALKPVEAEGGI